MKIGVNIQTSSGLTEKHVLLKAHITKILGFYQSHQSANKTNFVLGPLRLLYPNAEEKEKIPLILVFSLGLIKAFLKLGS